ncbi:MAG: FHA domain-containing protein [Pseudomonadota bacterium]
MFSFFRKKKANTVKRTIEPVTPVTPAVTAPAPAPSPVLPPIDEAALIEPKRRAVPANKTRLMGFETSDGRMIDAFDADKAEEEKVTRILQPVALVMVIKGPGVGECFALPAGKSEIGRGEDQAIRLDFGDMAVSRSNHAAVVYDPDKHSFLLGHGGKSNVVRLNGKPVVSTTDLKSEDEIQIGETTMRFVAICSDKFNWIEADQDDEGDEDDDLEIA